MSVPNPLIIDAQMVAQTNVVQADALGDGAVNAETLTDNRPMPHITIGEVETLATGEAATATMTGTYAQPVLNLGLPRGPQGEQGVPGSPGEPGAPGPAGPGVPAGGSAGEVMTKASGSDYDTEWTYPPLIVTYGETTYNEIYQAIQRPWSPNRAVLLKRQSGSPATAPLVSYGGNYYAFAVPSEDGKYVRVFKVTSDGWTESLLGLFDGGLSSTSTNGVQNKVITSALASKFTTPAGNPSSGQTFYFDGNSWGWQYAVLQVETNATSLTDYPPGVLLNAPAENLKDAYVNGAAIIFHVYARGRWHKVLCTSSSYTKYGQTYSFPLYRGSFVFEDKLILFETEPTNVPTTDATYTLTAYPIVGVVPAGGTQGQVLKKNSSTNYDASWTSLTPSDIGAMAYAYGWEGAFLQYSEGSGSWTAADLDLDTKLLNSEAAPVYLTDTGGGTYILNESLETVAGYVLSNRKVLFLEPLNDNTEFRIWRYEFASYANYMLVLSSEYDIDDRAVIEFYPNPDDGYQTMKGTFQLQPNGRNRIPLPGNPNNRDSLVYNGSSWEAKAATPLAAGIPYGECDNTSTSTAFTATVPGITELRHGTVMLLKNGVVTSASGFTININGLGAKPSYNNMAAATADTTLFNVNYTMLFIYDENRVAGGCWVCYRGYNSDTNTISYQIRTNSTQLPTVTRTRYYRILFTNATNDKWVPANTEYDNSATSKKTVNQNAINPFGRIVYLGNSTNYAANANVTATAVWDQYAHALGYSFNRTGAALTLTSQKPVYVKCAPQADGSAIMDSTEPIVQALPSTDDGKIYIYLGIAYSATNIELVVNHPVYYYKNGAIRLWTGPV